MMKIFNRVKIKLAKILVAAYLTVLTTHHVDRNASTLSMRITNHALVRFTIILIFSF